MPSPPSPQYPSPRNVSACAAAGIEYPNGSGFLISGAGSDRGVTMAQAVSHELLQRIRDIIAAETGVDPSPEVLERLQATLATAPDQAAATPPAAETSSREVTVLLADLRGFSSISEAYPVAKVLELLNRYLGRMCEIAVRNGGTIDKFMGDSIMVLFGAPQQGDDDARRAVTCAAQMQIAMDEVNREHAALKLPELFMGIGINTGRVMAGLLGSELHSEYTVIGDEVNFASRIETFSLRGQVLVSESTFELCRGYVATAAPMDVHVKGKSKPVRLHEVLAIPSLGLQLPRQEVRKSPRVEVRIPFTYQPVIDKIVMPQVRTGVILDLGYHGIFAEVEPGLTTHSDIRLGLDLSLVGGRADDVYAKVLGTHANKGRHMASMEFTSVSVPGNAAIRQFVQTLIQGSPTK
ncbi:MAG: adenylate cyclase [Betaproteobacteria bacterium]|nr:MAG: adenylate cyclase [Betaproteobacteria bacterium]